MRAFTAPQKALLRAPEIQGNLLAQFNLDSGTYYFCDDIQNLSDGVTTYIGANSLANSIEIKSGSGLAAEPLTLTCDGNRMTEFGIDDPAKVLREMMEELHKQRRVDFSLGLRYPHIWEITLKVPLYAGKINHCRMEDGAVELGTDSKQAEPKLIIVLDALASRYNRSTFRVRSDEDQREIEPTDAFYSYVNSTSQGELNLFWGKAGPSMAGGVGAGSGFGMGAGPGSAMSIGRSGRGLEDFV